MTVFWWVIIGILGLCWGSFLNVLIVRSISGESIITPASKCPKCNSPLLWWQNIPIISFILLKGKCHFCKRDISFRYPIIELLGLGIFIFAFTKYASLYDAIATIGIFSMLLTLVFTDVQEQKVSKNQCFIIMLLGLLFNRHQMMNSILGCFVGAGIIILLTEIGIKLFKKETFGIGDIYLLGALGAVVGFDRLFLFTIYALLAQVILILPSYILNLYKNKQTETLKYLIYFVTTCLFLYVLKSMAFWGAKALYIGILTGMLFFAYKLSKELFNSIKNPQSTSYCPLAPAIAISCLLFLI